MYLTTNSMKRGGGTMRLHYGMWEEGENKEDRELMIVFWRLLKTSESNTEGYIIIFSP